MTLYHRRKKFYIRFIAMISALLVVLAAFFCKIIELQIVNAQYYIDQSDTSTRRIVVTTAARGEIIDRYGRPIVTNREGFNVVFDAAYLPAEKTNDTILTLTKLFSKSKGEWTDELPISKNSPYGFEKDMDYSISKLRTTLGLTHYATAENCFDSMVERYGLQGLDKATQRTIMGVRYSMEANDFSVSQPFIFAEDISTDMIEIIEESSFSLPGVDIRTSSVREYVDDNLAAHIIGTVGLISAEEWEKLGKDSGYQYNDKIGKSGIEAAAEKYLRGTDGKTAITTSSDGDVISTEVLQKAVSGNTVQLTIDKQLQKVTQNALKEIISEKNAKAKSSSELITGAAVVVMSTSSGEILAAANYPSYNMTQYKKNYSSLLNDSSKPLFNRAFNGQYAPGSTFKPATAVVGLQLGTIDTHTEIYCSQRYTRFKDYQPSCLHYHASINVTEAISQSCNYFFYDLGYKIGIDKLNKYCKQLGLGVKTGVEINESSGILAGPEERETLTGGIWNPGDTIQAAIGQSDNAFTPLQLAQYVSTIANGGTRYKAHLIKSVKDYTMKSVVDDDFIKVLNTTEISESAYKAVKEGMLRVTSDGTASASFGNYSIKVGGKTGTATAPDGKDNAVFIGFAPYDDPEIAISIVIENGGYGSSVAPLAKKVFDGYFFGEINNSNNTTYNTLIS